MEGPQGISAPMMAKLISYFNFMLFFSSLITMSQFFWRGDRNYALFQLFNILFAVIFFSISFTYLLHHKDYYDGYAYLTDMGSIKRFAFRWDIFSIMFWFILIAVFFNVLYFFRYRNEKFDF